MGLFNDRHGSHFAIAGRVFREIRTATFDIKVSTCVNHVNLFGNLDRLILGLRNRTQPT